ncbi:hypothetical protein [Kinneretia aquatilis]|nr:hypothetical protein [Paucibacter aquatile]
MSLRVESKLAWWLLLAASVVLIPVIPPACVMGVGWLFPGQVPWFYADASVPIGALLAVSAVTFLFTRANFYLAMRLVALGSIIFCMSFFARIELVFAEACVTQRGSHINFQQQQHDREATKGATCDS